MKRQFVRWGLAMGVALLGAASIVHAEVGETLIDALVKKGVLSYQEAEDIRADMKSEYAATPGGMLHFGSDALKSVTLYGDARLRYEWRAGSLVGSNQRQDRDRYRYRLRFGIKGDMAENTFFGIRLETANNGRSTNATFGDHVGTSGANTLWGKGTSDAIYVGQIYLGWKATDWLTLVAGRQANPYYSTSMVWDGDLNPEGLSEQMNYKVNDSVSLFGNFGQWLYDDTTDNSLTGQSRTDSFMLAEQVGVNWKVAKDVAFKVGPTLYTYSGTGNSDLGTYMTPNTTQYIGHLMVLDVPAELDWKMLGQPFKVFGDFATNLDASSRAGAFNDPTHGDEGYAYQVGLGVGSAKKAGSWEAKGFYQSVDAYALDINMVDSDLFDGRVNMNGFVLQGTYAFTDAISGSITYANASHLNNAIPTYGSGDISASNLTDYQLVQLDLNWRF